MWFLCWALNRLQSVDIKHHSNRREIKHSPAEEAQYVFNTAPFLSPFNFTVAAQPNTKNWSPTIVFACSLNMSIKLICVKKPGGAPPHQCSEKYQKALYCLVWRRGLVMPIMSNHNQKSIFSNSLLEKTVFIESDRFVFPEMGYVFMKTT